MLTTRHVLVALIFPSMANVEKALPITLMMGQLEAAFSLKIRKYEIL